MSDIEREKEGPSKGSEHRKGERQRETEGKKERERERA